MLCVISRGNWNNGSNAGSRNRIQRTSHQSCGSVNATYPEFLSDGLVTDASAHRPVFGRECFTTDGDQNRSALVSELFTWQRPPTVVRAIRAIVVNAIQCVRRCWRLAHVGNKCVKRSTPGGAHNNAAPTVVLKKWVDRVFTPLLHAGPSVINGLIAFGVGLLSRLCCSGAGFTTQTAARLHLAALQVGRPNQFFGTAVAHAPVSLAAINGFNLRADQKPTKPRTRQVQLFRHFSSPFTLINAQSLT